MKENHITLTTPDGTVLEQRTNEKSEIEWRAASDSQNNWNDVEDLAFEPGPKISGAKRGLVAITLLAGIINGIHDATSASFLDNFEPFSNWGTLGGAVINAVGEPIIHRKDALSTTKYISYGTVQGFILANIGYFVGYTGRHIANIL